MVHFGQIQKKVQKRKDGSVTKQGK